MTKAKLVSKNGKEFDAVIINNNISTSCGFANRISIDGIIKDGKAVFAACDNLAIWMMSQFDVTREQAEKYREKVNVSIDFEIVK